MSKAVLVLDMPRNCKVCSFKKYNQYEGWDCLVKDSENIGIELENKRPNWCPLRELPKKTDIHIAKTMTTMNWIEGWNACIDVITGKMEG